MPDSASAANEMTLMMSSLAPLPMARCWLASLLVGLAPAGALAADPAAWFSRTWQSDEGLPANRPAATPRVLLS